MVARTRPNVTLYVNRLAYQFIIYVWVGYCVNLPPWAINLATPLHLPHNGYRGRSVMLTAKSNKQWR